MEPKFGHTGLGCRRFLVVQFGGAAEAKKSTFALSRTYHLLLDDRNILRN